MRLRESRAARRFAKATRNLRGTDGSGAYHEVQLGCYRPPARDQVARELLDQISKEHGSALNVEEHDLGSDQVAVHQDLIDLLAPIPAWRSLEVRAKDNVPMFPSQSRRGVDFGTGVGALPLWKKQVMKRIGSNNMLYLTNGIDLCAQAIREPYWRPDEKGSV
jgi:hypothetical protein